MAMKFENKKLNKNDHAKVDRDAGVARNVVIGGVLVALVLFSRNGIEKVPWKKVSGAINKVIFKV